MTKKDTIKDALGTELISDPNSWGRRFYRCYIDGSYTNSDDYRSNVEYIKENQHKPRKMRSFAITAFTKFLQVEFSDTSRVTIQQAVKELYSGNLEALNDALIDDAMDLIEG